MEKVGGETRNLDIWIASELSILRKAVQEEIISWKSSEGKICAS